VGSQWEHISSCHTFAVRALERATRISVNPSLVFPHSRNILASSTVHYLVNAAACFDHGCCSVNTSYHLSPEMVDELIARDVNWLLGSNEYGE
jgi:hypothetical protein